jgi:integrase
VNQSFVPYIYSREELRTIFRGAGQTLPTIRRVSPQTLRTSLMLLYATGALTGEVVALRLGDVDFKRCLLTIGKHPRHVPFGSDLRDVLGRYIEWRKRRPITRCRSIDFAKTFGKSAIKLEFSGMMAFVFSRDCKTYDLHLQFIG